MRLISAAWPRCRWESYEDSLAIWHEMLEDMDLPIVKLAVKRMIATLKYPPSVADLRESVANLALQGAPTAGQAWGQITAAIGRYGYYQPDAAHQALGDDLWSMVRQIGGWTHLCEADNLDVIGAQFERRYQAMTDKRRERIQVPRCIQTQFAAMLDRHRNLPQRQIEERPSG